MSTHTFIIIHSKRTKEHIYKYNLGEQETAFCNFQTQLFITYAVDTAQKLGCSAHEYVWGIISLENVSSSPVLILLLCFSNLLSNWKGSLQIPMSWNSSVHPSDVRVSHLLIIGKLLVQPCALADCLWLTVTCHQLFNILKIVWKH